jgi:hypothetical protein
MKVAERSLGRSFIRSCCNYKSKLPLARLWNEVVRLPQLLPRLGCGRSKSVDDDGTEFQIGRFLDRSIMEVVMGRGLLLWLIGIPIPIILLIWILGGLH